MKRVCTLLLSGCVSLTLAQPPPQNLHDSIWKVDSALAVELSDSAFNLRHLNPKAAYEVAQESLVLAERCGLTLYEAYAYAEIGLYHKRQKEYPQARKSFEHSIRLRIALQDSNSIAAGYNNLGLCYNAWQKFDTAMVVFAKGLEFAPYPGKGEHDKLQSGFVTSLEKLGRYREAEALLRQLISRAEQKGDSGAMAARYQNLGKVYMRLNRYALALKQYDLAAPIYAKRQNTTGLLHLELNRAAIYLLQERYEEVVAILEPAKLRSDSLGLLEPLGGIYRNLGLAYDQLNQPDSAFSNFRKGIALAEATGRVKDLVAVNIPYLKMLNDRGQFEEVLAESLEVEALINDHDLNQFWPDFLLVRSNALAGISRFEDALNDLKRCRIIQDSLAREIDHVQETTAGVQLAKSQQMVLKRENDLQAESLERERAESDIKTLSILILTVSLAGLALVLWLSQRNTRLKARSIEAKKNSDEKFFQLIDQTEQTVREAQSEAREEASKDIGQDLHDHVSTTLATVQMNFDSIRKKMPALNPSMDERLDEIRAMIQDSCESVRDIAHKLIEGRLEKHGLVFELKTFLELLHKAGSTNVTFVPMNLPERFELPLSKEIYAVVRVLVINALKHAQALEVTVQMLTADKQLHITVEDDGRGFDFVKQQREGGHGLTNAQHRVKLMGGEMQVETSSGSGTVVMVKLPLNEERI